MHKEQIMKNLNPWERMIVELTSPRPEIDEPAAHVTLDEKSELMSLFITLTGE
jgi:hypothetical protein